MIAVNKNINNVPASLTSANCQANLLLVLNTGNPAHKDNISGTYYASPEVVKRLKAVYNSKCAYCEAYEPEPEVEHYRPKKRVTGVPGHPGYYWLCYEWTNLLPACHDCNKNGAKGNHFPVQANRVNAPTMIGGALNVIECQLLSNTLTVTEVPLLLNPEVPGFDPFHYFRFEADGRIRERQPLGTLDFSKANETIRIARLDRDKLYLNLRRKQIRYYMKRLKGYLIQFLCGQKSQLDFENMVFEVVSEIKGNTGSNKEYSFFWSYFYRHFNDYINRYFNAKYRPRLFQLVNQYKANNP